MPKLPSNEDLRRFNARKKERNAAAAAEQQHFGQQALFDGPPPLHTGRGSAGVIGPAGSAASSSDAGHGQRRGKHNFLDGPPRRQTTTGTADSAGSARDGDSGPCSVGSTAQSSDAGSGAPPGAAPRAGAFTASLGGLGAAKAAIRHHPRTGEAAAQPLTAKIGVRGPCFQCKAEFLVTTSAMGVDGHIYCSTCYRIFDDEVARGLRVPPPVLFPGATQGPKCDECKGPLPPPFNRRVEDGGRYCPFCFDKWDRECAEAVAASSRG
mmetsp:Transcript_43379/g.86192  ORF Transcript_43379/g.86192 Transcript_43379/m.86192 type:complete len:266 (-) Transcript_43379:37-834(-)|eukprot:CAMPEP_0170274328 /NCGR_PEP_ID=MMETSP0116_2-20130129/37135_1 /TAXON_ID=400756 /ORGANISM="Durinskia baltica, Strain CSIRO CS-38" /LENGTH=265 /DNA_ID=CAMNT_0010525573 /DNA_START=78 /DNA_END=875 /DNA_ORIENTATION=+